MDKRLSFQGAGGAEVPRLLVSLVGAERDKVRIVHEHAYGAREGTGTGSGVVSVSRIWNYIPACALVGVVRARDGANSHGGVRDDGA